MAPQLTWGAEAFDREQDRAGFVHDGIGAHPGSGTLQQGYEAGDLTRGLVAYWPLEEGSGAVAADETELANHGALTGASWVAGTVGSNALSFDGTTAAVTVDEQDAFDGLTALTISAFLSTSTSSSSTVSNLVHKQDGPNSGFRLAEENGTLEFGVYGGADGHGYTELNSTTGISDGVWHHVCGTWDGTTMRVYVDGLEEATATQPGSSPNDFDLGLGADVTNERNYLTGTLDDIRLYDRALSQPEVEALATRTAPTPVTPGATL